MTTLSEIPIIDVREGGPLRQAEAGAVRARALRDDCLSFFPRPVAAALPLLDGLARTISEGGGRPLGLLTHHRVHDAALWSFLAGLLPVLLRDELDPQRRYLR